VGGERSCTVEEMATPVLRKTTTNLPGILAIASSSNAGQTRESGDATIPALQTF
jgi:hypothetical protein